jgi:uncharacterized membrane protein YdbT with pleckstrin-like domain
MAIESEKLYKAEIHLWVYSSFVFEFLFFSCAVFFYFFHKNSVDLFLDNLSAPKWTESAVFFAAVIRLTYVFFDQWILKQSTKIYCTKNYLTIQTGIFSKQRVDIPLRQIESTSIDQRFIGRIFGFGSITFHGTGGGHPALSLIKDPERLTDKISELSAK